jgi:hypothetical protein
MKICVTEESKWEFKLAISSIQDKEFKKHLPIILLIMFTETIGFKIVILSFGLSVFEIGLI